MIPNVSLVQDDIQYFKVTKENPSAEFTVLGFLGEHVVQLDGRAYVRYALRIVDRADEREKILDVGRAAMQKILKVVVDESEFTLPIKPKIVWWKQLFAWIKRGFRRPILPPPVKSPTIRLVREDMHDYPCYSAVRID